MLSMSNPRYPSVQVELNSSHPLALVSAIRQAMRRSGVDSREIHRFSQEAFATQDDPEQLHRLCRRWALIKAPLPKA